MRLRSPFLLAVVIAQAIVIVCLAAWPPPPITAVQKAYADQTSQAKEDQCSPLCRFWNWTTGDAISFYTSVLALFSGVLVGISVIQIRFLIRADQTATISARAAERSAKAAIGVELPIIKRIYGPSLVIVGSRNPESYTGVINSNGVPSRFSGITDITFINDGRTAAFPKHFRVGWTVIDGLPDIPVYSQTVQCQPDAIINGNAVAQLDANFVIEVSDEERARIVQRQADLWLYLDLTYSDFMNEEHQSGICLKWERHQLGSFGWAAVTGIPAAYTRRT